MLDFPQAFWSQPPAEKLSKENRAHSFGLSYCIYLHVCIRRILGCQLNSPFFEIVLEEGESPGGHVCIM